jgi:asparagine synthase (glutamine-hydrolysing)
MNNEPVDPGSLKTMLGIIRYRGPDECGILLDEEIGIGNVRLSIIDIVSGQQPFGNDDGTKWIVYNGEVFNYIELRHKLMSKGVRFRTHSDTEVVLRYYELYGSKCLGFFNGQFAFAIWDSRKEELFLARDRVGIRPLFYYSSTSRFIFGSEIKAILASGKVAGEPDYQALQQVFTFWATIAPNTVFKNIKELPPGHFLSVTKEHVKLEHYWDLTFPPDDSDLITNEEEAGNTLDILLRDAVSIRLRADVPVAAYLSGGIDSSATTYYIKQVAKDQLNTFSIGFTDKQYDESHYQKQVSGHLKTHHQAFACSNSDIAECFPEVVYHSEIPLLRSAPAPMYLLSKKVRENNIKVVITGEGADEILGGYNIFKEMYIRRFWAKYPNSAYRPLLLKKLYPYIPQLQRQNGNMLKFFFGYRLNDISSPVYSHLLRWNNSSKISYYFEHDILMSLTGYDPISDLQSRLDPGFNAFSHLAKAQWLESTIFMSGYLLSSQGDRMAMANSVEGRYPFLDYRVIEYCSKLHPDLKLKGLNEKYLLKKIMKDRLPLTVLNRSKQAYRAPIATSFFGPRRPDYIEEMLSPEVIRQTGIFNPKKVQALRHTLEEQHGSELENMSLAAILSTQLLVKQLMTKPLKNGADMSDCNIVTPNKN